MFKTRKRINNNKCKKKKAQDVNFLVHSVTKTVSKIAIGNLLQNVHGETLNTTLNIDLLVLPKPERLMLKISTEVSLEAGITFSDISLRCPNGD